MPGDFDLVKERVDIVQLVGERVHLRKAGRSYSGLCPFHAEKTPSFSINGQEGLFHCFGCQKSGDVITFVREMDHLDFVDAVERCLARITEAAIKVGAEGIRRAAPDQPFEQIRGLGNILRHAYDVVDPENLTMWRTPAFLAASMKVHWVSTICWSAEEISNTRSTPESASASVSGRSMSPSTSSTMGNVSKACALARLLTSALTGEYVRATRSQMH